VRLFYAGHLFLPFFFYSKESYAAAQALRNSFLQAISLIVTSAPAVGAQYNKAIKKKVIKI